MNIKNLFVFLTNLRSPVLQRWLRPIRVLHRTLQSPAVVGGRRISRAEDREKPPRGPSQTQIPPALSRPLQVQHKQNTHTHIHTQAFMSVGQSYPLPVLSRCSNILQMFTHSQLLIYPFRLSEELICHRGNGAGGVLNTQTQTDWQKHTVRRSGKTRVSDLQAS